MRFTLFLLNAPKDDVGNAMLSENVVELMKNSTSHQVVE